MLLARDGFFGLLARAHHCHTTSRDGGFVTYWAIASEVTDALLFTGEFSARRVYFGKFNTGREAIIQGDAGQTAITPMSIFRFIAMFTSFD